jgi:hypothetical protein
MPASVFFEEGGAISLLTACYAQRGLAEWLVGVAGRPTSIYISHMHSGIASGGAFEYVRSANSRSETLRSRRIRAAINVTNPAFIDPVLR